MKIIHYVVAALFFSTSILNAQTIIINEVMSSNYTTIADEEGTYSDWIEIFNPTNNSINLFNFSLSDDFNLPQKWTFPNIEIKAGEYLLIFASGNNIHVGSLHTNFKINKNGEKLWLRDANNNIIDFVDSISIPTDYSFGRNIFNNSEWLFYDDPTPGSANESSGVSGYVKAPNFSHEAGFYDASIILDISVEDTDSKIYYSTDGSSPDSNSYLFNEPIIIDSTSVIKAIAVKNGFLTSTSVTKTYFINEETTLPVFSISTDPSNLWDDQIGIYVEGVNGIPGYCNTEPKNYNQDWERPITLEFFDTNKDSSFSMEAGMKIYGGCTRSYPLKSLAIYARRQYGYKSINYPLFPDLPFSNYEAFVLRNSGDDYYSSFMRDALMSSIVSELDIEKQAYRPTIVFLNGEYWGIHNLREKINEHFLAQHKNVNPDNIDLLEMEQWIIEGDADHYNSMISFIASNDIRDNQNFEIVEKMMDVDNFISYCISQIYFDNTDWPGHNIKYWRQKEGGKWRWILFDTDFGFGFKSADNYKNNTLAYATDENGITNANPPWSTFLLRKLLENESFRDKFINTYADYSNSIFKSEFVNNKITFISEMIKPEIPRHISKWGEILSEQQLYAFWLNNINVLKNFSENRIGYLHDHFINKFALPGIAQINVSSNVDDFGKIKINSLETSVLPWTGTYFKGIPINLKAISKPGYKFIEWRNNGTIVGTENEYVTELIEDTDLVALFEVDTTSDAKIIINEINYNSASFFDTGDWFEIRNISKTPQNLTGWSITDGNIGNKFILPSGLEIGTDSNLVITEDSLSFRQYFPKLNNIVGNIDFKLSNEGETIKIFDSNNFLIDSVQYGISNPWPDSSNGTGYTHELSSTDLDNDIPSSWHSSIVIGGTPGKDNSAGKLTSASKLKSTSKNMVFKLFQNYPNPFNPSTSISYSIPSDGQVTLAIYDVLGNEVAVLENGYKSAGTYSYTFDASNLTSGIYFYTIKSGQFVEANKMLLMK